MRHDRGLHWLAGRRWLALPCAVATALAAAAVLTFVQLAPHVEQDFFFASDDPAVADDGRISALFPGGAHVILAASGEPGSSYYAALAALTRDLRRVPGVERVQSATAGPKSPQHARASPFWKRLVGAAGGDSTLVLATLDDGTRGETIEAIERVARAHSGRHLRVHVSGVPYVIELIRRSLLRDMIVFTLAAGVVSA